MQLLGHFTHGAVRLRLGEFVAARTIMERCMDLTDPTAYRTVEGLSFDPYVQMLTYLAVTLAYLGYIDQARSRMDEALSESRRLGHAHSLVRGLNIANWIGWVTGAPEVHLNGISGSIDRARLSALSELGTGIPGQIVGRARTSAGRPRPAHAGVGGVTCHGGRHK
jgi:hypothetical protein